MIGTPIWTIQNTFPSFSTGPRSFTFLRACQISLSLLCIAVVIPLNFSNSRALLARNRAEPLGGGCCLDQVCRYLSTPCHNTTTLLILQPLIKLIVFLLWPPLRRRWRLQSQSQWMFMFHQWWLKVNMRNSDSFGFHFDGRPLLLHQLWGDHKLFTKCRAKFILSHRFPHRFPFLFIDAHSCLLSSRLTRQQLDCEYGSFVNFQKDVQLRRYMITESVTPNLQGMFLGIQSRYRETEGMNPRLSFHCLIASDIYHGPRNVANESSFCQS